MELTVECFSGRKADERPIRFTLEGRQYQVKAVLDQWYDPESIYYKVLTDDGNVYILRIGIGGKSPLLPSLYNAYYGEEGLKNPTAEEWAAFAANCNLRDMGTHLCALPTGEHCPKGLICLRLRACSAQEERPAHLSANAGKPRA